PVLKPQALGSGRLPRTAEDQPPALPRRVRVPLQSPPDAACRLQYPSRHRCPYGPSSLPPADPQNCVAKLHLTTTAYSPTGTSCRSASVRTDMATGWMRREIKGSWNS